MAYAVVTRGTSESGITAGAGLGYAREAAVDPEYTGVAMLAGERQVAGGVKC